ncbi:methyl-accepting chemotaxis protein [Desulfovibrio gilichinskyi]|uniref:methyl-accepting chemotaxis protein n=1 Tax=Desulfovibrio gilichinskyi TaxID=1519643 RepID=UPI000A15B83C|nr:methyl-accepting chemotaxis protein [Desulfovibrio gilichinskyi]
MKYLLRIYVYGAIKGMVGHLQNVVSEIQAAADNVASGSEELSSSAQNMSQGATEQLQSTSSFFQINGEVHNIRRKGSMKALPQASRVRSKPVKSLPLSGNSGLSLDMDMEADNDFEKF